MTVLVYIWHIFVVVIVVYIPRMVSLELLFFGISAYLMNMGVYLVEFWLLLCEGLAFMNLKRVLVCVGLV